MNTLKIKKGFESKLGSKLAKEFIQELVFGERPSEINFSNKKELKYLIFLINILTFFLDIVFLFFSVLSLT